MVLIGEAREKISKALEGVSPMRDAASMDEAVGLGFKRQSPWTRATIVPDVRQL